MVWSSKYMTGNAIVDNDHKQIFALVKDVLDQKFDTREKKIDSVIDFLARYTAKHFDNEEKLMDECNYVKSAEHKKQHTDFLAEVGRLQAKIAKEGTKDIDISIVVNDTVVTWLVQHVLGSDKLLADFYRDWQAKARKGM